MAQVAEVIEAKARRRRWAYRALALAVAVVLVITFKNPLFRDNFGVVDPQRVYRSAQPTDELHRWITDEHVGSILNLRGGSTGDPWYVAEVDATRDRGVDFYDFPMSAVRRPLRREILILLDLFDRCRYPLLIHCKSGSDRTGLAAALYLMSQRGEPPERAMKAFSLHYGHVPLFGPEHLHEPILEYGAWLASQGAVHSPSRFRTWVERDYMSEDRDHDLPPLLQPGPRKTLAGERSAKSPTPSPPMAGDSNFLKQKSD